MSNIILSLLKEKRKLDFLLFYKIDIAIVRIIIFTTAINNITFPTHFNHVVYCTLASSNPPMIAPQVGVNRFTNQFAATISITVTSTENPSFDASGPIIGVDNVANPDDDGTRTDKNTCSI